jgi:hypothetical protein
VCDPRLGAIIEIPRREEEVLRHREMEGREREMLGRERGREFEVARHREMGREEREREREHRPGLWDRLFGRRERLEVVVDPRRELVERARPMESVEEHMRAWERGHPELAATDIARRRGAWAAERTAFLEGHGSRLDPRLGAWWERRPVDVAFLDERRFRLAYEAARTSAHAVRKLLAGYPVHGYDLAHLRAAADARGLPLPEAIADAPLAGLREDARLGSPYSMVSHGFRGGGWRHPHWRGGPAVVVADYGPACVPVDPTDPSDPCYSPLTDPSLSGPGPAPAALATEPAAGTGGLASELAAHRRATETGIRLPAVFLDDLGASARDMAAALKEAFAGAKGPPAGCTTGCTR